MELSSYYDAAQKRLVQVGHAPSEDYWDGEWERWRSLIRTPDKFVLRVTRKYLPKGARIIDAGCGLARTVYGLHHAGYDAYGIDFAPKTVEMVTTLVPELKISVADVRAMNFPDEFFNGVWSLGVIEHFYDGYQAILDETHRVLKPGGFAFVTVPSMSPLRSLKARLGKYPRHEGQRENFYQFILPPKSIIEAFESRGFSLVSTRPLNAFGGFMTDTGLERRLTRLYRSEAIPARVIRKAADAALGPVASHARLYVFRKII